MVFPPVVDGVLAGRLLLVWRQFFGGPGFWLPQLSGQQGPPRGRFWGGVAGEGGGAAPAAAPSAAPAAGASAASAFLSEIPAPELVFFFPLPNRLAIAVPIAARNPTNPDRNQPLPAFFAADRAALFRLRNPSLLRAAFHPADNLRPVLSSAQSRARAPARLTRPGFFLSEVELGVLPHRFFGMLPPVVESEPRPHRGPPPRRELLPPRGVVPPLAPRDAAPLPSRTPPLPPDRGEEPPRPNRPPPLVRPPPMRGKPEPPPLVRPRPRPLRSAVPPPPMRGAAPRPNGEPLVPRGVLPVRGMVPRPLAPPLLVAPRVELLPGSPPERLEEGTPPDRVDVAPFKPRPEPLPPPRNPPNPPRERDPPRVRVIVVLVDRSDPPRFLRRR